MDILIQSAGYGFIALVLLVMGYVFFKILISAFISIKDSED